MTVWAHVPTPLAPQQSSLYVVIQSLCTHRRLAGQRSAVVVADNRDIRLEDASLHAVDYTRYCERQWFTPREMNIDHLSGLVGKSRPYSSRIFIPAVEAMSAVRPEVVFLHEGHHATPSLPLWVEALPESELILYAHISFSRGYRRPELKRLLSAASGIIFISRDSHERAVRFLGRLPAPAVVVNNGVDTERFHSIGRETAESLRIAYVGEISPHKGLHLLLASLRRATKMTNRRLTLRIAGKTRHRGQRESEAYERQVRAAAAESGIHVEWLGFVPHAAMPDVYRTADVVCVPSIWREPFGMVVLEALASGAAVIASPTGGLRDAGGEAALYIDPSDDYRLASTIADFANHPELLGEHQTRGREHALRNTWSAKYLELEDAVRAFAGR